MREMKVIRQMMVCKKVSSSGKICYGKSFNIVKLRNGEWQAICTKCDHAHEMKINVK